jgi:hypothetical protein
MTQAEEIAALRIVVAGLLDALKYALRDDQPEAIRRRDEADRYFRSKILKGGGVG